MAINLVSLVQQFLTPQLVSSSGASGRRERGGGAEACRRCASGNPRRARHGGRGARRRAESVRRDLQFRPGPLDQAQRRDDRRQRPAPQRGRQSPERPPRRRRPREPGGRAEPVCRRSAPRRRRPLLGAVTHAAVGTIGQQDPSNWSDPSAILSMLNSQKGAIAAALPPEVSRALGASGLLAGLGGAAAAAAQTGDVDGFERGDRRELDRKLGRQERAGCGARVRAASRCGRSFSSSSSCCWRSTGS